MDATNAAPLMAPAMSAAGVVAKGAAPLNLDSLSVRELICELATTEALLRQRLPEFVRGLTVSRQALIVSELRRRARSPGRDQDAHRHVDAIAVAGALVGG